MAALDISVLGELKVLRHGKEVALPHSKKTRALLAYLAVVDRRAPRSPLSDALGCAGRSQGFAKMESLKAQEGPRIRRRTVPPAVG